LHHVAVLIDDISSKNIAVTLNSLLDDEQHWKELHLNCKTAATELNWQNEEKKLVAFYKKIFG
jgi:hypothetical protein